MLEIILGILLVAAMVKIANNDDQSGALWGLITFAACAASLMIPLPFLRFLIAGIVVFILMIVVKVMKG